MVIVIPLPLSLVSLSGVYYRTTGGAVGSVPKRSAMSGLIYALLKSPATTREALLGT